jgi:hypothetical protein
VGIVNTHGRFRWVRDGELRVEFDAMFPNVRRAGSTPDDLVDEMAAVGFDVAPSHAGAAETDSGVNETLSIAASPRRPTEVSSINRSRTGVVRSCVLCRIWLYGVEFGSTGSSGAGKTGAGLRAGAGGARPQPDARDCGSPVAQGRSVADFCDALSFGH